MFFRKINRNFPLNKQMKATDGDYQQMELVLNSTPKPKQIEMFAIPAVPPEPNEFWFSPPRAKGRGKVLLPPKCYKSER